MLKEITLFGVEDKVETAIERLQHFEPPEGYYLAFSGGKDSIVIKELAKMAGVKHDSHYSVTTIDPPPLVYYIREHHSDVIWDRPSVPFIKKMETKGFPSRRFRWCCALYKENGGNGRCVITGIRSAESYNRSRRKIYEHCYSGGYKSKNKTFCNPIIDWADSDVWDFIKERKLVYCSLYDEGWKRIGCLFCPMSRKMRAVHAERFPGYRRAFIKAFEKFHSLDWPSVRKWKNGEAMFEWWIADNPKQEHPDQKVMVFE